MAYVVYRLTSQTSGKSYIGKSKDLKPRLGRHRSYAANGSTYALHAAIRKYGYDDFVLTIVVTCETETEAFEAERSAIQAEGTRAPGGYNMTDGGEGMSGYYPSEATRQKRSESLRGRAPCEATQLAARASNTGRTRSDESRRKQSEAMRGRTLSDEHRARIGQARTGVKRAPFSAEHREKLGAATRGRKLSPEVCAQRSERQMGHPVTDETRAKLSAYWARRREARQAERIAWLLVDEQ